MINDSQSKCNDCPFYMDDCDGEDFVHVCHNPAYIEPKEDDR